MINIKKEHEEIRISSMADILNRSSVVEYNDDLIEIPGVLILKRAGSKSLLEKVLNPGIDFIEIKEDDFSKMIEEIVAFQSNDFVVAFDEKAKPSKYAILNLNVLKDSKVFVKITEDTIYMNNFVFTNNEFEFHGNGMFTAKKVLFLSFEDLNKVREVLV